MDQRAFEDLLNHVTSRYYGKYRGQVIDNMDPTNRGRVKVMVPSVIGDDSIWALPSFPFAGNNVGTYLIPEPGTAVWVEFEAGDKLYPIWSGTFWADGELPHNETDTEASPSLKMIRTQRGLMITFDDTDEKLTLSDSNGSHIMTFDVPNGKIRIESSQKVVIEAPKIELIENATHPVVFGDNLLQYLNQLVMIFNTHMHPGELALGALPVTPMTPVASMPAATPELYSLKVTTG